MSAVTRTTPRRNLCTDMLVTFIICNQRYICMGSVCMEGGELQLYGGSKIIEFVIDARGRV